MSSEHDLLSLLSLNPYIPQDLERFEGAPIIDVLKKNPQAAAKTYQFWSTGLKKYPLQQAIWLKADIEVVEAIYNSYPPAIRAKNSDSCTVVHLSIQRRATAEVVSFLLSKWPEVVYERDLNGDTLLQYACQLSAQYEIVSLLLHAWPEAIRMKNRHLRTPIFSALRYDVSLKVISLLLDHHPDALKEKDRFGNTPLHFAANAHCLPLDGLQLVLEKWPYAIIEKNCLGNSPVEEHESRRQVYHLTTDDNHRVFSFVYQLYSSGDQLCTNELKEVLDFFIQINWWEGVPLLLDCYPSFLKEMDVHFKMLPVLFYIAGQRCRLKALWRMVMNELDTMEGV